MLIDTHILIWMLNNSDPGRLGDRALMILKTQPVTVSVASLIEIAVKKRKGKLTAPETDEILNDLLSKNAAVLNVEAQHISSFPRLESSLHADPFDLLLVAQAISEKIPFITNDSEILKINYPGLRLIDGRL